MQTKKPVNEEMNFFYNDAVLITSDTEEEYFEDKLNFYGGEFWTVVDFDRIDGKLYYTVEIDEDKTIIVPQDCLVDADDVFDDEDCWCNCTCECCWEHCRCNEWNDVDYCPDCGCRF